MVNTALVVTAAQGVPPVGRTSGPSAWSVATRRRVLCATRCYSQRPSPARVASSREHREEGGRRAVDQLGPNALGETLEPGRVGDCYLGLLLPPPPAGEPEAGTILILAPAALLHPRIPQPAGSLVYQLLTGHPEREAGELVFVAD